MRDLRIEETEEVSDIGVEVVVSRGEKLRKRTGIESERKQFLENRDCRGRMLVEEQEAEMMRSEEGHNPPTTSIPLVQ